MHFSNQNGLNVTLMAPQMQTLPQDRKTCAFFPRNLLRSPSGFPCSQAEEGSKSFEASLKAKQNNKDCLDALMTTNSSLSSEQFEDIQAKDLNEETKKLCKFFKKNKYPTKEEMKELSCSTSRTVKHLETWFKNRRRALAMKGMLPNYQRKNKFSKSEVEILKEYFIGIKKPKKYHFEQIHAKLNKECSIKNIKNWFNHYKKKQKMGVSEHKKRAKPEGSSANPSFKQENTNGSTTNSQPNVQQEISFVQSAPNYAFQAIPIQKPQNNNMIIIPLVQNSMPFGVLPKSQAQINPQPMVLQNYCIAPQNGLFTVANPNMAFNLAKPQQNVQPQFDTLNRNFNYVFILNQPNMGMQAKNFVIPANFVGNECRGFETNGSV